MAYNRDWDRGKSAWREAGTWKDAGGAGNVRLRDDDYQGEGKRRKYNSGVCLSIIEHVPHVHKTSSLMMATKIVPVIMEERTYKVDKMTSRKIKMIDPIEASPRNDFYQVNPAHMSFFLV